MGEADCGQYAGDLGHFVGQICKLLICKAVYRREGHDVLYPIWLIPIQINNLEATVFGGFVICS